MTSGKALLPVAKHDRPVLIVAGVQWSGYNQGYP